MLECLHKHCAVLNKPGLLPCCFSLSWRRIPATVLSVSMLTPLSSWPLLHEETRASISSTAI